MDVLPLFKSHYSIGRSILTLEDDPEEDLYPDSIIAIAKDNRIKNLYIVEDNMTSFLQAYTNCKKNNIKLRYGLRITITENMNEKNEESRTKNSKFIIFFKNNNGYKNLIKIFSIASKTGFYYEPRIDFRTIKSMWDNQELLLCVPFYDSFIYNNVLRNSLCTPDMDFCKPIFFIENNNLPFDHLIKRKTLEYISENNFSFMNTKSIYYKSKLDFKSYLTFRCINSRSCLNKPELEHMSSDDFCFESWRNINNYG